MKVKRIFVGAFAVLMLVCMVLLVACSSGQEATSDNEGDNLQEATVVRVVDGDTIIVSLDGVDENSASGNVASGTDSDNYRVRFIGVDTPESVAPEEERNTEAGELASEHTKEVLPAGTKVWLEKDVSETDKYDRLLRYVWLEYPDDPNDEAEVKDKMLNAQLVADGWAEAKSYPPDTKWDNLFASLVP